MRAGTENNHETSEYFDGGGTYKMTLPKDIQEATQAAFENADLNKEKHERRKL